MELEKSCRESVREIRFRQLIGKQFSYPTEAHRFGEFFLETINAYLVDRQIPQIQNLTDIHRSVSVSESEALYQYLYESEESELFQKLYQRFLAECVAPHFSGRRVFAQRKPGIRIHLLESTTVQFHTDEWYGHGSNVYNVWMPLTPAFDSNSLWLADYEASLVETTKIESEKLELSAINDRLERICHPVSMQSGEYLFFHAKSAHGSKANKTGQTRFSLDFRLLIDSTDAGKKSFDYYYMPVGASPMKSETRKWVGTAYMDARHGISGRIGSQHQRVVIREYARLHGITIVGDEMEIQTLSHHPSLLKLSEGNALENAVVLFSVDSLPPAREDRERIYQSSEKNKTALIFANEDLCFPFRHCREDIEKYHAK